MSHLSISLFSVFLLLRSLCHSSEDGFLMNSSQLYFGPDVDPKTQLIIETSSRPSHQLISNIFLELVTKEMKYSNVKLVLNDRTSFQDVSRSFDPNGKKTPSVMVNLEVQTSAGDHPNETYITDAGALGPILSPGIYIPQSVADQFWIKKKLVIDNWRSFIDDGHDSGFSSAVSTMKCFDHNPCAKLLLLNSDRRYLKPLTRFIRDNKLLIHPSIINDSTSLYPLLNTSKPSLLFTLDPNAMARKDRLVKVSTTCGLSNKSCLDLKSQELRKWIWREAGHFNPYILEVLQKIHFPHDVYLNLVRKTKYQGEVSRNIDYRTLAHSWMNENRRIWNHWLPNMTQKYELTIAGLFATNGTRSIPANALDFANALIKDFNKEYSQSSPYYFKLEPYKVSSNDIDTVLYAFNQIIFNCNRSRRLIGVLAMVYTDMAIPLAELSNHYKIPIISQMAESLNNRNGSEYPYFFRMLPDHSHLGYMIKYVCSQFKWKRIAIFRQNDNLLMPKSLSPPLEILLDFEMEEQELVSEDALEKVKKALKTAKKKNARIFFLDFQEKGTAAITCLAAKMQMTPSEGYVWFTSFFSSQIAKQKYYVELKAFGCNEKEINEITKILFCLKPTTFTQKEYVKITTFMNGNYLQYGNVNDAMTNIYYAQIIDSYSIFHKALQQMITSKTSNFPHLLDNEKKMEQYRNFINNTNLEGVTGDIQFVDNGRLPMTWSIYVQQAGFLFPKEIWKRNGTKGVFTKLQDLITMIARRYPNNQIPDDGSTCMWNIFTYKCSVSQNIAYALIVGVVIITAVVIIILIFFFIRCYIKRKYAKYPRPFAELLEALSDYEIPRSALQLQYTLGEGAFGTVYYGEMKHMDTWTGVAAKLLREGASNQERREFLCEALKMRNFKHVNVMTIIGVVTSEPRYVNIMEFMLLGDLRKYLLTRHHLAKTDPTDMDIRPSTLTSMALDIARGLEYLQRHKLVHRDLACRNCLVDKEYRVKIGDFGMTREIDDKKAYYRFEHPGILPVRWMAPESIQSGIFNFTTDVWSYGVVLYEIVTFGNQPYRGRTNEEVIDAVKHCSDSLTNYLVVPETRIPHLIQLMRSCWSHRPEGRPLISYLISQLEVNPDCVRPCLDESPPDPGETHMRGQGLDRCSVIVGDVPTGRNARSVASNSVSGTGAGGSNFTRMISGGSRSSCERTRFASGNRVDTDLRHCDSVGRVNNLTINSFTTSIASRLGFFKDSSNSKWYSGGGSGNGSKSYRHTCSQEFLSFSRHHSGDQEISTVSDPHAYQVDYDPLAFVTVHNLAANAVSNPSYGGVCTQRGSSSGGPREDDDMDTDQQTLLNNRRV